MKRKLLDAVARDIIQRIADDVSLERFVGQAPSVHIKDLLIQSLANHSALRLSDKKVREPMLEDGGLAILQRIESTLVELTVAINRSRDGDNGNQVQLVRETRDDRKRADNASKYNKVESMLKYIEAEDDKNGVRLVIMNFND